MIDLMESAPILIKLNTLFSLSISKKPFSINYMIFKKFRRVEFLLLT